MPARQAAPTTSRTRRCIDVYSTRRPRPTLRAIPRHPAPSRAANGTGSAPASMPRNLANIRPSSTRPELQRISADSAEARRPVVHESRLTARRRARNHPQSRLKTTGADIRQIWPTLTQRRPARQIWPTLTLPGRPRQVWRNVTRRGPAAAPPPSGQSANRADNVRGPAALSRRGLVGACARARASGPVGGPTDGSVAAKSGREPPGTHPIWPVYMTPECSEMLRPRDLIFG